MGTGSDETKIEADTSGETRPPPRQLPRSTSKKGGLGNAAEDAAENPNEDSSSQSSGGGILPSRLLPRLPARRLSRGNSGKGATFKGSLRNVTEDREADAEEGAYDPEEGGSVGSASATMSMWAWTRTLHPFSADSSGAGDPEEGGSVGSASGYASGSASGSASTSMWTWTRTPPPSSAASSRAGDLEEGGSVGSSSKSKSTSSSGSASRRLRKALPARLGRVSPMLNAASDVKSDTSDVCVRDYSYCRTESERLFGAASSSASSDSRPASKSDSSSIESSRSRALPVRTPLYAPGTWRRTKMGGPLPARRLTKSGSAKSIAKGASFRGSLKDVVEDKEFRGSLNRKDADANANYFNEDSSSQSSGGSLRPSRRRPLYAPGTWRGAKMGGPLPARRLTKSSSTKSIGKGSSFRGSLKNVVEDKEFRCSIGDPSNTREADDLTQLDMDGDADDLEESLFAHTAPHGRRKPLSARELRTGGKTNFRLLHSDTGVDPDMLSLSDSYSTYTTSRKDSLSNFVDSQSFLGGNNDASSDSELVNDIEESRFAHTAPHGRRKPLSARELRTGGKTTFRRVHSETGVDPDMLSLGDSYSTYTTSRKDSLSNFVDSQSFPGGNNDASSDSELVGQAPRASHTAQHGRRKPLSARELRTGGKTTFRLVHSETGVDPDMLSLGISYSTYTTSRKDSLMNSVDSQGFLGGTNDASSDSELVGQAPRASCRPTLKRLPRQRLGSLDSSASSLTGLADSAEYLGWDSQRRLADSTKDFGADVDVRAEEGGDGGGGEKDSAPDGEEESLDPPEKSWRIEDDEGSMDPRDIDPSNNDLGSSLSKIKRFSSKATEGIATKRPTWKPVGGVPTEIQTNHNSRRRGWYRSESAPLPKKDKAKDDKGLMSRFGTSWGGASSPSQSLNIDDEYYSRGTIRINQEEDVDTGKLRRELLKAAAKGTEDDANPGKGKLKMGFL